jgi:Domain of unknown function (DUF222)
MRSITGMGGVAGTVAAAGAVVSGLVEAVQAGALAGEGHDELSGLLGQVRGLQAGLEYVVLATVREVDVRGSFVSDGALSSGAWVRQHTRMTPSEAAGAVRTARVLGSGELPGTAAALAAGEIDPAHVRVIAAGVAGAPAGAAALIEPEALAVAKEADPRVVAGLMARFRHALDPDAADAAALARYEKRGITFSPLLDGLVHIRGLADEVTGALLMSAINAANPPVTGDRRTAAQARIDALADICRTYLGSPHAPMSGGGHAHLIVTLDAQTLTSGHTTSSGTGTGSGSGSGTGGYYSSAQGLLTGRLAAAALAAAALAGGARTCAGFTGHGATGGAAGPGGTLSWVGPIGGSTARRIGCDADVTYVAIDGDGSAQVAGREKRFFDWAQRKAMIARDGDRCAVPFCDRPVSWADGHHLQDWALGGPTTIENGALPCAGHHTMCHEGGWTLTRQPDGRYLFRHRNGKTIGPEPHPPGHNRPPPHNRR